MEQMIRQDYPGISRVITPGDPAPDFEAQAVDGRHVRLSQFRGRPVLLTFLRGFMCPYCRAQLARLRDGYDQFRSRGVEILAIGPNPPATFEQYWHNESIPFIGLPDADHKIALLYRQEVNLFKLGRMPFNSIVDAKGYIRYVHYGVSMRDIPSINELLQVIDQLNNSSK